MFRVRAYVTDQIRPIGDPSGLSLYNTIFEAESDLEAIAQFHHELVFHRKLRLNPDHYIAVHLVDAGPNRYPAGAQIRALEGLAALGRAPKPVRAFLFRVYYPVSSFLSRIFRQG